VSTPGSSPAAGFFRIMFKCTAAKNLLQLKLIVRVPLAISRTVFTSVASNFSCQKFFPYSAGLVFPSRMKPTCLAAMRLDLEDR
jgi:hypothetical protein